jgi:hypothetical protein
MVTMSVRARCRGTRCVRQWTSSRWREGDGTGFDRSFERRLCSPTYLTSPLHRLPIELGNIVLAET